MHLLDIVLPVFLVIGLGRLLRRLGFLDVPVSGALSRLVFYVAAPVLLLRSIGAAPLHESLRLPTLGVLAGVTAFMALVAYLACWRCAPARRGVLAQGTHRSNMVFVGLPVVANAYGDGALGTVGVTIGFMVVLYNLLAVLLLTLPHRETSARDPRLWLATLRRMLTNPLVLGCLGGLLLSAGEVALPSFLDRALQLVGRTAMPVALLTVGADLDLRRLRGDLGPALLVALIKLVVYPGLVLLGLRWLGLSGTDLTVPLLIMASPTAVVSYVMAREMKGDAELAGAIVIGTTSLSLLTYIGWLALVGV